jgi:hypothetical protein
LRVSNANGLDVARRRIRAPGKRMRQLTGSLLLSRRAGCSRTGPVRTPRRLPNPLHASTTNRSQPGLNRRRLSHIRLSIILSRHIRSNSHTPRSSLGGSGLMTMDLSPSPRRPSAPGAGEAACAS